MVLALRACCGLSGSGWSGIGVAATSPRSWAARRSIVRRAVWRL